MYREGLTKFVADHPRRIVNMDLRFCFIIELWMLISFCCINVPTAAQQKTPTPQQKTPTSQQTTTTSQQQCIDIEPNCPDIGHNSFCNVSEHKPWIMENCRSYCGYCTASSAAQQDSTTTQQPCEDIATNCTKYGRSYLCSEYIEWAAENCTSYCGLCHAPPVVPQSLTSTGQACVDEDQDCATYEETSLCIDNQQWALFNCRSHCRLCGKSIDQSVASSNSVGASELSTNDVSSSLGAVEPPNHTECSDVATDCNEYNLADCNVPQFREWARSYCRKSCSMCQNAASPIVTASPPLTDATTTPSSVPTTTSATGLL